MANISRLRDTEIENNNVINADHLDEEFDQLINESNDQDSRISAIEGDYATTSEVTNAAPPGVTVPYIGTSAPSGWVLAAGKTIGNASSGGTERANADTESLFTLLWDTFANAEAPVSGGRGASAAADFAANKTITLPDLRGRVIVALDNLGGSSANRLTSDSVNGAASDTPGATGGDESHALTIAEMPGHTHTGTTSNNGSHSHSPGNLQDFVTTDGTIDEVQMDNTGTGFWVPGATSPTNFSNADTDTEANHNHTFTTNSSGSGATHSNTQPWLAMGYIIKL